MLHIVLVEDNPADAEMLATALAKTDEPTTITVLEDGLEAVQYFANVDPGHLECDLVLLDLNLPQVGGFEILERIKSSEDIKSLPVVILSGSSSQTDVDRCYRAGANSYICKPIHLDDIFTMAGQVVAYWSGCVKLPSICQIRSEQPEIKARAVRWAE